MSYLPNEEITSIIYYNNNKQCEYYRKLPKQYKPNLLSLLLINDCTDYPVN